MTDPSGEVRTATGRGLAMAMGDSEVDRAPATRLLDEDAAVSYETAAALLRRGDHHALRLVLVALDRAGDDHADEIMAAVHNVLGHDLAGWQEARQSWRRGD